MALTYLGATQIVPNYNLMGIAKAALEASIRYLAFDLGDRGIRVNAISAGPIKTASRDKSADFAYSRCRPAGRAAAAQRHRRRRGQYGDFWLRDLSNAVTADVHFVDAGYHAMGLFVPPPDAAR